LLVGLLFAAFAIGRDSKTTAAPGPLLAGAAAASEGKQRRVAVRSKAARGDGKVAGDAAGGESGGVCSAGLAEAAGSGSGSETESERDSDGSQASGDGGDRMWEAFAGRTTVGPLLPFGAGPLTRPEEFTAALALGGGNKWSEPPGALFWCRGARYLQDRQKV
jgi:hypothetical protein